MNKNKIEISENELHNQKINRPWIITLFCITGIIWLFLILLGIIGMVIEPTNQFKLKEKFELLDLFRLIIEITLLITGIISLRFYWLMKKKGVLLLGIVAGLEISFNFLYGIWPLSFSCGCDFPIILTILGLIYFKQMN